MKKTLLIAGALLTLTAAMAFAAPGDINIAWDDCPLAASPFGLVNKASSCASNTAVRVLIASFTAPDTMPHFNGQAGVVDIQVAGAALDPWWQTYPGGCLERAGALTGDFSFAAGPLNCLDAFLDPAPCCNNVWAGGLAVSGGIDVAPVGPNRVRVRTISAVPDFRNLLPGPENYVFRLTISQIASGAGTPCPGCLTPACIVFNSLLLTQPAGEGDNTLTTGPRQYATWQGGVIGGAGCPVATPTQKSTWGSIKAMYR